MKSRNMNISLADYCKDNNLSNIKVEGVFHPENDLELWETDDFTGHFKIKGNSNWGVSLTRISLVEARNRGVQFGYFHQHENERVYLSPPLNIGGIGKAYDGLIPCLECDVGIRSDWSKD